MEDHAHWSPRPMEPRPQGWDHAHRVLSKEVQYSGARDTVPLTHQLCTLREVAPWGLSSLSRLGVCKALRSPLRSSPLRSQPLTFTTNHWANTRCPVGGSLTARAQRKVGDCPAGTRQRPAEAAGGLPAPRSHKPPGGKIFTPVIGTCYFKTENMKRSGVLISNPGAEDSAMSSPWVTGTGDAAQDPGEPRSSCCELGTHVAHPRRIPEKDQCCP